MVSLDERVELVLAEAWGLLPAVKYDAWITEFIVADIGAKHGSYCPDDGTITLSERLFTGADAWELMYIDQYGNSPAQDGLYCSRALHTTIHECWHAIGYATGMDRSPVWLALSGWEETWEDRQSTGRYFERRPGWGDQEGSSWRYRKGTWFCREYSTKSPYEDYADCGTSITLGWHSGMTHHNGRAKIKQMLREAWGQASADRLEAAASRWRNRWAAGRNGV